MLLQKIACCVVLQSIHITKESKYDMS